MVSTHAFRIPRRGCAGVQLALIIPGSALHQLHRIWDEHRKFQPKILFYGHVCHKKSCTTISLSIVNHYIYTFPNRFPKLCTHKTEMSWGKKNHHFIHGTKMKPFVSHARFVLLCDFIEGFRSTQSRDKWHCKSGLSSLKFQFVFFQIFNVNFASWGVNLFRLIPLFICEIVNYRQYRHCTDIQKKGALVFILVVI